MRGYPATRLAKLLQDLDDLTGTGGDQDAALAALRKKPGLLAKLEL